MGNTTTSGGGHAHDRYILGIDIGRTQRMMCSVVQNSEDNMGQHYSEPEREQDEHALPAIEVFQLTAEEGVQQDEDLMWQAMKRFPLASMNSREWDKAIAWAIEESGATGGFFWWTCFPGCLPDSCANGPFKTYKEALKAAQDCNG